MRDALPPCSDQPPHLNQPQLFGLKNWHFTLISHFVECQVQRLLLFNSSSKQKGVTLQKLRFQTWWVSSYTRIAHWIALWFLTAQGRLLRTCSKISPFISKYYKCDLMFLEWAVDAVHISMTSSVTHLTSPETSPSSLRAPFPRSRQVTSLLSWLRANNLPASISRLYLHASWAWRLPFTYCGTSGWNSTHALGRHISNSPRLWRAQLDFGVKLPSCQLLQVTISSVPSSRNQASSRSLSFGCPPLSFGKQPCRRAEEHGLRSHLEAVHLFKGMLLN